MEDRIVNSLVLYHILILELFVYFVAAIAVSGKTFDNLEYEWADDEYKWDKDRNLKAREPYFSSVNFKKQDQATTKATFEKLFEAVFTEVLKPKNVQNGDACRPLWINKDKRNNK